MPTIIINGSAVEARVGERLLNVARRNAAHIGFVCDSRAVCQTCLCQVLTGRESLSPPNDAELNWLTNEQIRNGERLACQTVVRGAGPVVVETKVEELRRQTLNILAPPPNTTALENAGELLRNIGMMSLYQLQKFPFNMISSVLRAGPLTMLYPIRNTRRYLDDTQRIFNRITTGQAPVLADGRPTATYLAPAQGAVTPVGVTIVGIGSEAPAGSEAPVDYVLLRNESSSAVDFTGWTLRGPNGNVFTFPTFDLQHDAEVRVWACAGDNDAGNIYWANAPRAIHGWTQPGTVLTLRDPLGGEVSRHEASSLAAAS